MDGVKAARVAEDEERQYLPRHARGDPAAFAELLAAYRAPIFGYLVRVGVAPEARDDVFQEIFLKVHGAAGRYDPSRPLKPWLFTIAANAARDHFRRRGAAGEAEPTDGHDLVVRLADPAPGPERSLAARDTVAWLEEAIGRLSLAQREVLVLSAVEGLDQNQAAAALGLPVNTVKTHLRRARLALARALGAREGRAPGEEPR